jgi:hypothetical protein
MIPAAKSPAEDGKINVSPAAALPHIIARRGAGLSISAANSSA